MKRTVASLVLALATLPALATTEAEKAAYKQQLFSLQKRGDYAGMVKLAQEKAVQGNSSAMWSLANFYADGIGGLPRDMKQYAFWFTKAAEQDDTFKSMLAAAYQRGDGMPKDIDRAVFWYTKAAENGDVGAMSAIGEIYFMPENKQPSDWGKALYWKTKAAENGDAGDADWLSQYYYGLFDTPPNIKPDPQQGLQWLQKAAELGDEGAKSRLAVKLYAGDQVPKDRQRALVLAKESLQYLWPSQCVLGQSFLGGEVLRQDKPQAYKWLKLCTRNEVTEFDSQWSWFKLARDTAAQLAKDLGPAKTAQINKEVAAYTQDENAALAKAIVELKAYTVRKK